MFNIIYYTFCLRVSRFYLSLACRAFCMICSKLMLLNYQQKDLTFFFFNVLPCHGSPASASQLGPQSCATMPSPFLDRVLVHSQVSLKCDVMFLLQSPALLGLQTCASSLCLLIGLKVKPRLLMWSQLIEPNILAT